MKKKSYTRIILILILLAVGATWIVMANRFETYVKNEILLKIQMNDYFVKTDLNSLKINKYKFSVTTGELELFPHSEFLRAKIDQATICYNPYNKQITAHLGDKKLEIGSGDFGVYIDKPFDTITFNKEILSGDFSHLDIKVKSEGNIDIKDMLKNEVILNADQVTFSITGKQSPNIINNYQLGLNFEGNKVLSFYTNYEDRVRNLVQTLLGLTSDNLVTNQYSYKELELTGGMDTQGNYAIELSKDHFKSFIQILKGEKEWHALINEFNPMEELYFINAKHTSKNSAIDGKMVLSISNDGQKIAGKGEVENSKNLSDSQKNELKPFLLDHIYELITYAAIRRNVHNMFENITANDFEPTATRLLNLKNMNFKFSAVYDKISQDIDHSVAIKVNNHEFDLGGKGNFKEMKYDGNIKLSDPDKLIHSIVDYADKAIYPLIDKAILVTDKDSVSNQGNEKKGFKLLINNIKENGFKALSALSKEAEFNPGDPLTVDLHFSPKEFEFKLNNKSFIEIITDERVIPFLKALPSEVTMTHEENVVQDQTPHQEGSEVQNQNLLQDENELLDKVEQQQQQPVE